MHQMTDEQIQELIDKCTAIEDGSEALAADAASMGVYLEGVLASEAPAEHALARLASRAAAGSGRAREQFAAAAQRMLLAHAAEFECPGAAILDLVQEGNVALLGALDAGESSLDALETTARNAMSALATEADGLAQQIPAHLASAVAEYLHVREHLAQELGRAPKEAEIGEHCDLDGALLEEVREFLS